MFHLTNNCAESPRQHAIIHAQRSNLSVTAYYGSSYYYEVYCMCYDMVRWKPAQELSSTGHETYLES